MRNSIREKIKCRIHNIERANIELKMQNKHLKNIKQNNNKLKTHIEWLSSTINDLTLCLSMWHGKYQFDEDHIYKQKIMINNASVLIGKARSDDEMRVMINRVPDNIALTVEQQWASELFEELCTIKAESTPIDASEPVTERHPAVESLISQLSVILYGDENE